MPRWGLDFLFAREPRAALVPRLPWAGLLVGLWPARFVVWRSATAQEAMLC